MGVDTGRDGQQLHRWILENAENNLFRLLNGIFLTVLRSIFSTAASLCLNYKEVFTLNSGTSAYLQGLRRGRRLDFNEKLRNSQTAAGSAPPILFRLIHTIYELRHADSTIFLEW